MKRRKAVTVVLAFTLAFCIDTLSVYGENIRNRDMKYHEMSYEDELKEAADELSLNSISDVTNDLILPSSYGIHISIDWQSSDESVISKNGHVCSPSLEDGNQTITLTAALTSTKISDTIEKTFEVTVKALSIDELLEKETAQVRSYMDYILTNGYQLPDKADIGISSELSWSVLSGAASIKDGLLTKASNAANREPLILRATLKNQSYTKTVDVENLILLDEYAGYILSFFGGNDDKKTIHLAYSYDGEHFFALNDGNTILKTSNKRLNYQELRDPFIMRKKDGSFALLATNGWNSTSIYLWDSDNLTSFTNERTSVLSIKGTVGLSGFHTWAPECNYDPLTDTYTVYWSDPKADNGYGKTFYNTSKDLISFSEPGILYAAKGSMIDASIKKHNGYYYLVYNDAYGDNETGKGGKIIYMAKSASLEPGSFQQISGALSPAGTVSEGPFLFENFQDKSWMLMYDHYSLHKFGVSKTADLTSDDWDYLGVSHTMPTENIRHGGVIAVTEAELNAIIETYRKSEPVCAQILTPDAVTASVNTTTLQLPETVQVILTDGQKTSKPVTWDTSSIDTKKPGTYTAAGSVTLNAASADAVSKAAIEIHINEQPASFPWKFMAVIGGIAIFSGSLISIFLLRLKKKIDLKSNTLFCIY